VVEGSPGPPAEVVQPVVLERQDDDRDTLFRLAGTAPPQAGCIPMLVRPGVLRLLDRMSDLPALVISAKSDVLAWNPLAAALFGDFSTLPPARRNLIRQRFLGTDIGHITLSPAADSATDCVACLRTAQARYPNDPDLTCVPAPPPPASALDLLRVTGLEQFTN
jgi:hypothetical protein